MTAGKRFLHPSRLNAPVDEPEFRSCEARLEETPHLALPRLRDRHPLPKGEGRRPRFFSALSPGERVARCRRFYQPERAG
jgi:hypothetical protein